MLHCVSRENSSLEVEVTNELDKSFMLSVLLCFVLGDFFICFNLVWLSLVLLSITSLFPCFCYGFSSFLSISPCFVPSTRDVHLNCVSVLVMLMKSE